MRDLEPRKLGSILGRRKAPGGGRGKLALEQIAANWPVIVGERLAAHCRPTRLSRGVLHISADSSTWATEVSAVAGRVAAVAERALGEGTVKKVRVRAGANKASLQAGSQRVRTSDQAEEAALEEGINRGLGRIEDERLRKSLERLARANRSGKKSEKA